MKIKTLLVFSAIFVISCGNDPVSRSNTKLRRAVEPSVVGSDGKMIDPKCIPVDGFVPPECIKPPVAANPPKVAAAPPAAPNLEKSCRLHDANFYDEALNPLLTISSGTKQLVTKSYAGVDLSGVSKLTGLTLPAGTPSDTPITIRFCDDLNQDKLCSYGKSTKASVADASLLVADGKGETSEITTTAGQIGSTTVEIFYSQLARGVSEPWCDNVLKDPLVVELGENTPTFSDPSINGFLFDIENSGMPLIVSWPANPTTGFLVNDKNGNGQIDNGAELFGDATFLKNGLLAPDGFTALKDLVTKGDGTMDSKDTAWSKLGYWPGFGNVKSLAQVGITKISLKPQELQTYDEFGNYTSDVAKVTVIDSNGNKQDRKIYEVWLKALK